MTLRKNDIPAIGPGDSTHACRLELVWLARLLQHACDRLLRDALAGGHAGEHAVNASGRSKFAPARTGLESLAGGNPALTPAVVAGDMLAALREAWLDNARADAFDGDAWLPLRAVLRTFAGEAAGDSAMPCVRLVLAIKRPIVAALQHALGREPERQAPLLSELSELFDRMALHALDSVVVASGAAAAASRQPPIPPSLRENAMSDVSEIMSTDVEIVEPQHSLRHASVRMQQLDVGSLPVCAGKRLLGMLTDRDIIVRGLACGLDPDEACVSDIMSPDVAFCTEEQDSEEVMRVMGDKQVRRLPVVDVDKNVVGIVSLADLALRQPGHIDKAVREISDPDTGA